MKATKTLVNLLAAAMLTSAVSPAYAGRNLGEPIKKADTKRAVLSNDDDSADYSNSNGLYIANDDDSAMPESNDFWSNDDDSVFAPGDDVPFANDDDSVQSYDIDNVEFPDEYSIVQFQDEPDPVVKTGPLPPSNSDWLNEKPSVFDVAGFDVASCQLWLADNFNEYKEDFCADIAESTQQLGSGDCGTEAMSGLLTLYPGKASDYSNWECKTVDELANFEGVAIRGLCEGDRNDVCTYTGSLGEVIEKIVEIPVYVDRDVIKEVEVEKIVEVPTDGPVNLPPVFTREIRINEGEEIALTLDYLLNHDFVFDPEGEELTLKAVEPNVNWGSYDAAAETFVFKPGYDVAETGVADQISTFYLRVGASDGVHEIDGRIPLVVVDVPQNQELIAQIPCEEQCPEGDDPNQPEDLKPEPKQVVHKNTFAIKSSVMGNPDISDTLQVGFQYSSSWSHTSGNGFVLSGSAMYLQNKFVPESPADRSTQGEDIQYTDQLAPYPMGCEGAMDPDGDGLCDVYTVRHDSVQLNESSTVTRNPDALLLALGGAYDRKLGTRQSPFSLRLGIAGGVIIGGSSEETTTTETTYVGHIRDEVRSGDGQTEVLNEYTTSPFTPEDGLEVNTSNTEQIGPYLEFQTGVCMELPELGKGPRPVSLEMCVSGQGALLPDTYVVSGTDEPIFVYGVNGQVGIKF